MPNPQAESAHLLEARRIAEQRASGERVRITPLPKDAQVLHVLGVDYVHTVTDEGGDLYLTTAGFAHAEQLQPQNWYDLDWFRTHREILEGTGAVYATPTKPVRGESLALLVKFNRVGERVPIDTRVIENLLSCEFNGPFEEFAMVEELRHSRRGSPALRVQTQVPLAIYVPPDRMQPSQTQRFQWRVAQKVAKHPGIAIDILREYIMVYAWLPGIDAHEAQTMGLISEQGARVLNERATAEVRAKGFSVLDMKPEHLIVQLAGPERLVASNGQVHYGLVDFELLERTPEYEREVREGRRQEYQRRKRELLDGSGGGAPASLPANLHAAEIQGVRYVYGRTESTGGALWVVGRDPELFDYFLPERWRTTPQIRLLETHETYLTRSRDNIPLVWKISRVGERPEVATLGTEGFRLLAHGFSSPFEEVAMARWLRRRGIPTILPRAIYRTGHRSQLKESLFDLSRYRRHAEMRTPDGAPILETRRSYITIWDHWNGPDPLADDEDTSVFRSLDAAQAVERGRLAGSEAAALVAQFKERLDDLGVEALRLVPAHLLVSIGPDDKLLRDACGRFAARLCNFQYLCWAGSSKKAQTAPRKEAV